MELLSYIVWEPNEIAFRLGPIAIRWYSLCWILGLTLAYFIVRKLYQEQKMSDKQFEPLFIYCFFGILIGARLGHCLFYEPEIWLSSWRRVLEIVVPIHIFDDGSWKYTGYTGLASHGGTLGLMVALWLYCRKTKVKLWHVLDDIAIATPITACFIRLGNLMNSEIVGKVTDVPWAFIFANDDPSIAMQPRHPGQLYEAIAYFLFFFVMWYAYRKRPEQVGTGFFFGLCLTLIFTFRFFIEYTKEIQVAKEAAYLFDIGQLLSIPFVILGVGCMIWSCRKKA